MTSGDNGEWVRQGTPQDDNANWNEEPSEYGTAISPIEWDDYSSEQSVPVAPPRAHADGGAETAGSPGSPVEQAVEPIAGQESDPVEDHRSDDAMPFAVDGSPAGADPGGDGPEQYGTESHGSLDLNDDEVADAGQEYAMDEPIDEMTRPRPIAHDASGATDTPAGLAATEDAGQVIADDVVFESAAEPGDDGMDPVAEEQAVADEGHVDAAEYLAVDPVPAGVFNEETVAADQGHVDAAEYLAVDPVPAGVFNEETVLADEGRVDAAEYLAVDPLPAGDFIEESAVAGDDQPQMTADEELAVAADDEPLATADDEALATGDDESVATPDDDPVVIFEEDDPADIRVDDEAVVVDDDHTFEETDVTGTQDQPDPVVVDDELTQQVDMDDMEATQAVPVAAAVPFGSEHTADGLYRVAGTEETAIIGENSYPNQDAEVAEERQQAQLEAERQAREQRLGAVPTSSDNAIREDTGPVRIVTDKFFPSLGLFVLRIVTAGILGVLSYQILGNGVDATADYLGRTVIPEPRLVAWILGFTLGAMALLLVIGMLQRLVGLLLLLVAIGSLVFIRWGNFAIYNPAVEGVVGEKDLLLAAVGLLLFTIGGGAWGVDGAFRRTRATSKAEREG